LLTEDDEGSLLDGDHPVFAEPSTTAAVGSNPTPRTFLVKQSICDIKGKLEAVTGRIDASDQISERNRQLNLRFPGNIVGFTGCLILDLRDCRNQVVQSRGTQS